MKIGRGVSELWRVENRPLPLTWPMAYTTACTTVQAVTSQKYRMKQKKRKKLTDRTRPRAIKGIGYEMN